MQDMWAVLLIALGGLLFGGTIASWKMNKVLAAALGLCTVLAVASGVLRLGYFG
ncbi:hypothetical protein NOGI109294_04850 [Nocardiopsis gilva]|uniref:hypothetical protein n=1 Tax=Nocardiopsis gilva TaxID=280236 RepID=UPI000349CBB9|nr:hypothetical protein [Nocardiopsis gilva]